MSLASSPLVLWSETRKGYKVRELAAAFLLKSPPQRTPQRVTGDRLPVSTPAPGEKGPQVTGQTSASAE